MALERQLARAVKQEREPVRGRDGVEERVDSRLERLLLEQACAESVEGGGAQLLVGTSRSSSARARISSAARVEKVSASTCSGGVP
jgi:hypothetical protein